MSGELDALARAHALFEGAALRVTVGGTAVIEAGLSASSAGALVTGYRPAAEQAFGELADARRVDADLSRILTAAHADRDAARRDTGAVLAAARTDEFLPDNPIAARELLRRKALRLRNQRSHVLAARRRARRSRAALLALHYRSAMQRYGAPESRARIAVRAALSRLGRPYVWGATGPDRFDCSGLVKWAYAQAGVQVHRTTYDQINDGVAVPRSQVRPGDLVFPHTGHVQMAIGNGLVVEAPQPGSVIRISPIGAHIAIRRLV